MLDSTMDAKTKLRNSDTDYCTSKTTKETSIAKWQFFMCHTIDLHCPPFLGAQLMLSSSKVTVHAFPLTLKVSVRVKSVLELTWKEPGRPFLPRSALSLPRSSLRISTVELASSSSCSMTAAAGSRAGTEPFTVGFARSSRSALESGEYWKAVGLDFTISEGSAASRTSAWMELARAAISGSFLLDVNVACLYGMNLASGQSLFETGSYF